MTSLSAIPATSATSSADDIDFDRRFGGIARLYGKEALEKLAEARADAASADADAAPAAEVAAPAAE